jgi:hypothetical protein
VVWVDSSGRRNTIWFSCVARRFGWVGCIGGWVRMSGG